MLKLRNRNKKPASRGRLPLMREGLYGEKITPRNRWKAVYRSLASLVLMREAKNRKETG